MVKRYYKGIILFTLISILLNLSVFSQKNIEKEKLQKKSDNKMENPDLTRWKIYLYSLEQEVRSVSPENRKLYASTDIADAYWEIDSDNSRSMFITALSSVLSLSDEDEQKRSLLNYIMAKATRRDSELTKTLIKKVEEKQEKGNDDTSSAVALDLLKTDTKKAAQIFESFAPNGLQNGTANFFIFRLAAQDIQSANHLHQVYLNKLSANEAIPLELVLTLGGYSFGYPEFYSVDSKGELFGSTFSQVKDLSVNPLIAKTFLNIAFSRLGKTVQKRNDSTGTDLEKLNYLILFSFEYLKPEVARFLPETLPMWDELQQQGMTGVTPQQIDKIAANLQQIYQSRANLKKYEEPLQSTLDREIEEQLENAEKLADACQRDVIYSKAAISFSSRNNFKRALEVASKISDLKQIDRVKEVVYFNSISEDIKSENLEEINEKLKKISSPELKTVIYANLVESAFKKKDELSGLEYAFDEQKLVEKVSTEEYRSGFLFNLASVLLNARKSEGQTVLRDAVKSLNKQEAKDSFKFAVPIRVSLSCAGNLESWYGGFVTLPDSNIYNVIDLYARQNPNEALSAVEDVDDKITKIRLSALVSKIALNNEIKKISKEK